MKSYITTLIIVLTLTFAATASAQTPPASADQVSPLLISSPIPEGALTSIDGTSIVLSELTNKGPAVLIFYRGGWCPYCNRHLAELKDIETKLAELGYQVFAISPDRPEKLKETVAKNELSYTLLSDSPMAVTKAFGLAYKVNDATVKRYKSVGLDLEADSGYDHHLLPAPAVYIIGSDGKVKFNYVNPNYKERVPGDILLSAATVFAE
ncbi:MAG: peroxiredoxin-like family protein [Bacteroidota bacterium]